MGWHFIRRYDRKLFRVRVEMPRRKLELTELGRMHSFIEVIKREKCEWGDGLGTVRDSIAALKEG